MSQPNTLDVCKLFPVNRHRLTFETCGKLERGESLVLIDGHGPRPLHYQFEAQHTGELSWNCLQQGPIARQVRTGRIATAHS